MARSKKSLLYIGTHSYIAAIDPANGEERWRTRLPHGGFNVPSILIKGPFLYGNRAFGACALPDRGARRDCLGERSAQNGIPDSRDGDGRCGRNDVACRGPAAAQQQQAAAAAGVRPNMLV